MVIIYCDLIKKALKTIEDVPLRWKAAVQEKLEQEA
ncbi:MAG: CD1375 family protein [Paenibacillus dendritiformis]|nr:CD1375 family protein [Paenibacillus thiaminolyticus]MDU5141049.1 CD1375 family protein [Paenibacillus dendritiformis]WII36806.1 CD1375 family protein [Paenibacillus thiaminolyticus]